MSDEIEQPPQEQPESEMIQFDPAIVVGPQSPAQPMATVSDVEYRGNDGNHIIRLPDGRVVAVPALSEDKAQDIRAGLE